MNKLSLSLVAMACSFALAACSTSRGGDAVDSSKYLTEKPSKLAQNQSNNGTNSTTNSTTQTSANSQTTVTTPSEKGSGATNDTAHDVAKPNTSRENSDKDEKVTTPTENTAPPAVTPPTTNGQPQVAEKGALLSDSLFVTSPNSSLTGALVKVNADGSTLSRNPINDGKELLNDLEVEGVKLHLYNSYDLISGNGMDGFKVLSNADVARETPVKGDVTGLVGGWGSETEYNTEIFRNMRFGVVTLNNESTLFVQGYKTPSNDVEVVRSKELFPMPKSGKFLYRKGHALYGNAGNYAQFNAEVEADFSNKQLAVALQENGKPKLTFSATIEGNQFSGNSQGIESKGAFYGSLAQEVGGVFFRTEGAEKGHNGVFGAVDKEPIR